MSFGYKPVFDPTDADSLAASANVGAHIRAGSDGDLIASQTIAAEEWLNVASALFDGAGNALSSTGGSLDVNVTSAIDVSVDGEYSGGNTDPDNVGVIGHVRAAAPADTDQTVRTTAAAASSDAVVAANVHGQDVNSFGMVYNGATWDRLNGTSGAVHINDGGNSITVDASQLDVDDLNATDDAVSAWLADGAGTAITSTGGALDVNIASSVTLTVQATQLDIDDLNATDDAVQAWAFDGTGNAITSSGGALDVNLQSSDIVLTTSDVANGAIESTAKSVTTTTGVLLASQLANRKFLFGANLGNKEVYVGKSGVTTSNGFPIWPGEKFEFRLGPSVSLHAVAIAGTQDVRLMEFAA